MFTAQTIESPASIDDAAPLLGLALFFWLAAALATLLVIGLTFATAAGGHPSASAALATLLPADPAAQSELVP